MFHSLIFVLLLAAQFAAAAPVEWTGDLKGFDKWKYNIHQASVHDATFTSGRWVQSSVSSFYGRSVQFQKFLWSDDTLNALWFFRSVFNDVTFSHSKIGFLYADKSSASHLRFEQTDLRDFSLTRSVLDEGVWVGGSLTDAVFESVQVQSLAWNKTAISGLRVAQVSGAQSSLTLDGVTGRDLRFDQNQIASLIIRNSRLKDMTWQQGDLSNSVYSSVQFDNLTINAPAGFFSAAFDHVSFFSGRWIGITLANAKLTDVEFLGTQFEASTVTNSKFVRVKFRNVDFSHLNIDGSTQFIDCVYDAKSKAVPQVQGLSGPF
jgi:uncharacterized protein YjbI with pentapeptide repeats